MGTLRTDSPICRRIALAFLRFIESVEPAPGIELEGLDVARDCLAEIFKLDPSSSDDEIRPGLLIDLFSSWEASKQGKLKSDLVSAAIATTSSTTPPSQKTTDANHSEESKSGDQLLEPHVLGTVLKDELFGKFYAGLDKINFFMTSPDGVEDSVQLAKATHFFRDALTETENSGSQNINRDNLAETFKSQGNLSMRSKLYSEAIELYTCAIALCENNAVYYCNRAAAYTEIHRYTEAIEDCLKSIEIDPCYSKAYSRLGLAYYAQGKYKDALEKGFLKALQLDPSNNSVRENIQVAQQKLMEELQRTADWNMGSNNGEGPNTQSAGSRNYSTSFTSSFPVSGGSIPIDFSNIFANMASTAQAPQSHERTPNDNAEEPNEPEIRMNANINLNFGEVPDQLSDALRSMMGMLSSQQQHEPHEGRGQT